MDSFPKNTIILSFICCFCFLFSDVVSAAGMFFEGKDQPMAVNQLFEVKVFIDTAGENINTIEGNIFFPTQLLELKELKESNSIIIFWVEAPKALPAGKISFSGITPGGYQGNRGQVLSFIFQTKATGEGILQVRDSKVYLNDGLGTQKELPLSDFYFLTREELKPVPFLEEKKDITPPESFRPAIGESPEIFNGGHFLVFATQDKDSGVEGFFVFESSMKRKDIFKNEWQPAQSPYLLKDQDLRSYVYVKARDKAGNERVEEIIPKNPRPWYKNYYFWFIIIGIAVSLAFYWPLDLRKLWKKYGKK